ncbi:MAG: amino acid adenylation domain-containing protein [Pseudomonadota bacterium]
MSSSVIDLYALSPLQEGMLFHSRVEAATDTYIEQRWCTIDGDLDEVAFKAAWEKVVARHDVLRTEFHWQELEEPVQVVYDRATLTWFEADWSQLDYSEQEERFKQWLLTDRRRGFELDRAPLMRCALISCGSGRRRFVWTYHHLLFDGWCNGPLLKEVLLHYRQRNESAAIVLPESFRYRAYIDWLAEVDQAESAAYWQETLEGFATPSTLELEAPADDTGPDYTYHESSLDAELSKRLIGFTKTQRITANTIMQGAWAFLLSIFTDTDDVVFGTVVAGRPPELPGVDQAIGLFINTVPVRVDFNVELTVKDWLIAIQDAQRDRERHGYGNLGHIQAASEVPNGVALFETLLVFENYPFSIEGSIDASTVGLNLSELAGFERTNYPLTLVVIPGDSIQLSMRYDASRYSRAAVESLAACFSALLASIIDNANARLDKIARPSGFYQQRSDEWMVGPAIETPQPLSDLFIFLNEQAQQEAAIVCVDGAGNRAESLSYSTLTDRVSEIAQQLRITMGEGSKAHMGIHLERTANLPAALLACIQTGTTYIPLAKDLPVERLMYMLNDAELDGIIYAGDEPNLANAAIKRVDLANRSAASSTEKSGPSNTDATEESVPAYLIYTSGSTGKPKGVAVSRSNLANFLQAMDRLFSLTSQDRMLALTTMSFDISALEIFLPLINGATLVVAQEGVGRNGKVLADIIASEGITIMQATPTTWQLLADSGWRAPRGFKMLVGGEALPSSLALRLLAGEGELWNLYGPTETTVWSGALKVTPEHCHGAIVPVGMPIAETHFKLVDRHGNVQPLGATGELLIGGNGVATGYWQRPALTAERFLSIDDSRWYRTGDRMRYRADGLLDFLGRGDEQVKLRGYRIELGEIETALLQIAGVTNAVAAVRPDHLGDMRLLAWVVCNDNCDIGDLNWREQLSKQLPSYMVPNVVQRIDEVPLNPAGKVDRKALPEPAENPLAKYQPAERPADVALIAAVWEEVLGKSWIADNDDFFALGGHSLTATRMVSRLGELTGNTPPLSAIFESPRFADFAAAAADASGRNVQAIERTTHADTKRPVSSAQRRQYLLAALMPDNTLYGVPTAVRLSGELDIAALEAALGELVARHESLRMAFTEVDGEPYGLLSQDVQIAIERVDLSAQTAVARTQKLTALLVDAAALEFDLSTAPLWRTQLITLDEQEHVFAFNFHHIIVDGWSLGVVVKELAIAYSHHRSRNEGRALSAPEICYSDFAAWERAASYTEELTYWRHQLSDAPPLLALQTDYPRPAEQSYVGGHYEFEIPTDLVDILNEVGHRYGVTRFMLLLSTYALLLERHGAGEDIIIGTPLANRTQTTVESLVGLFVNSVALRVGLSGAMTIADYFGHIRALTLEAFENQAVPFDLVLNELNVTRSRSASPLFQTLFTLQNAPFEHADVAGLSWRAERVTLDFSKFDISLAVRESGEHLFGEFEYRQDLFKSQTIKEFGSRFVMLLQAICHASERELISTLSVLTTNERRNALRWGDFENPAVASEDSIQQAFKTSAANHSSNDALLWAGGRMTYRELDAASDRVAVKLQTIGIKAEERIGVLALPMAETIVAVLGILKAGCSYVPLDEKTPATRLEWIVSNADIRFALTPTAVELNSVKNLAWLDIPSILLDGSSVDSVPRGSTTAEQLAYIMYTSGSTGAPKSVSVPHRAVLRLVRDQNYAQFGPDRRHLLAAPLNFDATTFEIWGPLLNGGALVLPSEPDITLVGIVNDVKQFGVTTLWLTAGLFHLLIDEGIEQLLDVEEIIAGGDVLSRPHLRRAALALPNTRFTNGYGPTENTTFSLCHRFDRAELEPQQDQQIVPIGTPINGTRVYVLDANMEPVAPGVAGDLYLSGSGLARGYLGQKAMTAEAFLPNPFFDLREGEGKDHELTLYKTGDQVRRREDGALEFLGRADAQVKIRGFRTEPGEIERALNAHPAIQDVAVLVAGEAADEKRLIAYFVGDHSLSQSELRQFLLERLPAYLIPSIFVPLDSFPLGKTGKIDRHSLPAAPASSASNVPESAPASAVERAVLEVVRSVMPVNRVNGGDNFFDLGGDSIMALQIVSRLGNAGLSISPRQIFEASTFAELAAMAVEVSSEADRPAAKGDVPLTPIQAWFFGLALQVPDYFNQAVSFSLPANLDIDIFEQAFLSLSARHDALRLRFECREQQWHQFYTDDAALVSPERFKLSNQSTANQEEALTQAANMLHASFELKRGPLLKAAIFEQEMGETKRILLTAHHLIIDAVSWRILLDDLEHCYWQLARGLQPTLRTAANSYQAYAQQSTERYLGDRETWRSEVQRAATDIPFDYPQNKSYYRDRKIHRVHIDTTSFPRNAISLSLNLAALGTSLCEWAGQGVTIMLESHGRELFEENFSQTLGWFTALYPVTLDIPLNSNAANRLDVVDKMLDGLPAPSGYGVLRYLHQADELIVNPQVSFNYLGVIGADIGNNDENAQFKKLPVPGQLISGDNECPYAIEIIAWVEAGELIVEWQYDPKRHGTETITRLASEFRQSLIESASIARLQTHEVSTDDFDMAELDSEDLDQILAAVSFNSSDD